MAEHLVKRQMPVARVAPAGISPGSPRDAENAIYTLKRSLNIEVISHTPKQVTSADVSEYDLVVALDKDVDNSLKKMHPDLQTKVWEIADPYSDNREEYETCAIRIAGSLNKLKQELNARHTQG